MVAFEGEAGVGKTPHKDVMVCAFPVMALLIMVMEAIVVAGLLQPSPVIDKAPTQEKRGWEVGMISS